MGAVSEEEEQVIQFEKMEMENTHERIFVSVRLRPLNAKEIARNDVSDWECINDYTIIFKNNLPERSMYPTAYTFDRVFQCNCTTKQVYDEAAREVAISVVSGINSTIFAYGQTSSGKTYTMNGITEYTVNDIYSYIQKHEERAFALKFSAMEIYNEAIRDLLSTDATPLRVLDDPERGTIIEKLTEETLRDWSHLKELLSVCEAQRRVGETLLNETSSRSHQILRLTVESSAHEFLGKDNSSTLSASVNFVDLAGSERASQALSAGARLKEGCHINRSLLTLGTVIRKLSKGRNGHIPYRDSKLTRILQTSLGGNARTAIICTMSPSRHHIEQSKNTLLFASCAKEVATNAQVNVVMSDKALVKNLQRELARLESELRVPGPTSAMSDSAALLREKDLRIEKMEKQIKELTKQRDLAQSRLDHLLQEVANNRDSRLWADYGRKQKSDAPKAGDYEHSISESQGISEQQSSEVDATRFNTSLYSSVNNYEDDYDLQIPGNSEDYFLSDANTSRMTTRSPKFAVTDSPQGWESMTQPREEDIIDQCKEVRCIEMEESSTNRNVMSSVLSPEESEVISPFTTNANEDPTDQESVASAGRRDTDLRRECVKQKFQNVRKTGNSLVNPYADESPMTVESKLSSSRNLQFTRSRSCRATLMGTEENGGASQSWFEKYIPGRIESFETKLEKFSVSANIERSREDYETSQQSGVTDDSKERKINMPDEESITCTGTVVAGSNETAKIQSEKDQVDGVQETRQNAHEAQKTVKDVGLDPMKELVVSPTNWLLEFQKQQKEIIELWDTCYVSLVHRTYFFLLFKGDPTDLIYMEVELRRLSFIKEKFARGNLDKLAAEGGRALSPNSSMRALNREREMLGKRLQKKFSKEERRELYQKWGIKLDMKQRKLKLAYRLWTDSKDMDHIKESSALVAKLVDLVEPDQALKEMFSLNFSPRPTTRRFDVWKDAILPFLSL